MLTITIPGRKETELWDERINQFVILPPIKKKTIQLEHSLISISKWEAKYCKSFIDTPNKTNNEIMDYIKMMTITSNVPDELYDCLTSENIDTIYKYMNAPMTATTIKETRKNNRSRFTTSELIYCWMVQLSIPFECEKWHINRLIMLIRVCNEENKEPGKKRSRGEIAKDYAALNAMNRKRFNSKG